MVIVSLSAATGAFASGVLADDYAYTYSNFFTPATPFSKIGYTIFSSGYGTTSGLNYRIEVTNDTNADSVTPVNFVVLYSGTIASPPAYTGAWVEGYPFSRVGLRIDISGGTAISGYAWVGVTR